MATSTVNHYVLTEDGIEDSRYSVTLECTGHNVRWYAVRFEGHWLGESPRKDNAWFIARAHAKGRE